MQHSSPFMLRHVPRAGTSHTSKIGLYAMLPAFAPEEGSRAPVRGPDVARLQVMDGHTWHPQEMTPVVDPAPAYEVACQLLLVLAVLTFSM